MNDQIKANRRRAVLIMGYSVVVWAIIGGVIGAIATRPLAGAIIGGSFGVVLAVVAHITGIRVMLAVGRARPVGRSEQPRLHNLVDGLCANAGVVKPTLHVVDDPAPNAFVAARGARRSALVVTTGLMASLDRIELEAVVAHLLTRIRSHEVWASTLAAMLAGGPVLVAEMALRTRWWNGGRAPRPGDPEPSRNPVGLVGLALLATAPVVAPLVRLAAPARRTTLADLGACQLTRYPPGLAAALDDLADQITVTHASSAATAHLWLVQPMSGVGDDGRLGSIHRTFVTHPPLDERIALVREL